MELSLFPKQKRREGNCLLTQPDDGLSPPSVAFRAGLNVQKEARPELTYVTLFLTLDWQPS